MPACDVGGPWHTHHERDQRANRTADKTPRCDIHVSPLIPAWPSVCVAPGTGACTRARARPGAAPRYRSPRSRPAPTPWTLLPGRCRYRRGHGVPQREPARQGGSPTVVRLDAITDPGGSPVPCLCVSCRVAGAAVKTLRRDPFTPVLGALGKRQSIHASPRPMPAAKAAAPGELDPPVPGRRL
jgi:hypothetical protein